MKGCFNAKIKDFKKETYAIKPCCISSSFVLFKNKKRKVSLCYVVVQWFFLNSLFLSLYEYVFLVILFSASLKLKIKIRTEQFFQALNLECTRVMGLGIVLYRLLKLPENPHDQKRTVGKKNSKIKLLNLIFSSLPCIEKKITELNVMGLMYGW